MGYILLEGGAEFGGMMAIPDRRAIELAGGPDAPIRIIPAAAAPDDNHQRAASKGVRWFKRLGATNVRALPIIDRITANDVAAAETLRLSRLVYLLGGFPAHLRQTLVGSKGWQAMSAAFQAGAIIAGSSAGAMVLCEHYFNPATRKVDAGLGLISNVCVLPHYNTFGQNWVSRLIQQLPDVILVGIDEETGILNDGPQGRWQVYGRGKATLYWNGQTAFYRSGETFTLETARN
jgi:cyanophycinase